MQVCGASLFGFLRELEECPGRGEVFVWDHETDSRFMVVGGLRRYLERALQESWGTGTQGVRPLVPSGPWRFARADLGGRPKILSTNSPQTPS
jgi:hypothetical protein